jgi:superfamily II DNA or RNA helicase
MEQNNKITNLPTNISNKLLNYQINHTIRLINILIKNITVLDASDTGTGKTYSAIAVVKFLKLKPIIICPKSVMSSWKQVCKLFNVNPITIVNYETIKLAKIYDIFNNRIDTEYISIKTNPKTKQKEYKWNVSDDTIFIFDEVHKCRYDDTYNASLLLSAKETQCHMLLLSATIADTPENFKIFTYILNFLDPEQVKEQKISYHDYIRLMVAWMYKASKPMERIHHMIYPNRGSRIRIADLGDLFPETQIIAHSYSIDKNRASKIEESYKNIAEQLLILRESKHEDSKNPLTIILRARQEIELLKIPIFVELAHDFIENKYSVVLFVNFTQTLFTLKNMLKTESIIYGGQTQIERDKIIHQFQSNKTNIIICNIQAGGIGISLHDIHGNHPRASIISPNWSSMAMVQALGRIHRAGSKSKSIQRIVYVAETIEESITQNIKDKLKDINSINNGDLDLTNIVFDRTKRKFVNIN